MRAQAPCVGLVLAWTPTQARVRWYVTNADYHTTLDLLSCPFLPAWSAAPDQELIGSGTPHPGAIPYETEYRVDTSDLLVHAVTLHPRTQTLGLDLVAYLTRVFRL